MNFCPKTLKACINTGCVESSSCALIVPEHSSFNQVVQGSQSFANLDQIINYVQCMYKDEYFLKALENTKSNGYELTKEDDWV